MAGTQPTWTLAHGPTSKDAPETSKKMGRHRPCSALFLPLLLLLHLPLLSTGSTPKPSSLIGQGIRSASHPLDLEAQQSWQASQRASDCWGAFDLYFVLDK